MTRKRILAAALLLSACTTSAPTDTTVREIRGQLDKTQFELRDSHVVLRSTNRDTWRTRVDSDGRFKITVPSDRTYAVRFANATRTANYYDAFAYLQFRTGDGTVVRNIRITPGDPIDLGRIFPVTGSSSRGLRVASDDDGDDETTDDDADTDSDGRQDDDAVACDDDDDGQDMVPAESENDMMADVDADSDGITDDEDSDDCDSDSEDDDSDSDSDGTSTSSTSEDDESDSDSDSDGTSTSSTSDDDTDTDSDSDSDSDSEADMTCEDPAEEIEEDCGEDTTPTVDCTMTPSDPGCL